MFLCLPRRAQAWQAGEVAVVQAMVRGYNVSRVVGITAMTDDEVQHITSQHGEQVDRFFGILLGAG